MQYIEPFSEPLVALFSALSVAVTAATTGAWMRVRRREKRQSAELQAARRIIDEITHEQWVLLSEAGRTLSASLDYHETLLRMTELAVPSLADLCVVDLLEEDRTLRRVRSRTSALPVEELIRVDEATHPVAIAIRSGRAEVLSGIDEPFLDLMAGGEPERLEHVRKLGLTAAMVVPMTSQRGILGAITFALARSGRRYSSSDLDLARQLASRAALAVDNARLYRKEQEAVRNRDQLLAIVSHELKNPLTAIALQAQFLLKYEKDPRFAPPLKSIRSLTLHMQRIIADLLDLDKLDAGRIKVACSPEQACELVSESVELMRPLAEHGGVSLDACLPPDQRPVLADRLRINQVISNLLGNAIKFTPEGGEVRVTLEYGAEKPDSWARITVADSGPGISPENLDQVFDRYWQDRKTAHLGSGLGLSVAKGIVELHGGRIGIESRPGQGTQVWFTLPLAPPQGQQPGPGPDDRSG